VTLWWKQICIHYKKYYSMNRLWTASDCVIIILSADTCSCVKWFIYCCSFIAFSLLDWLTSNAGKVNSFTAHFLFIYRMIKVVFVNANAVSLQTVFCHRRCIICRIALFPNCQQSVKSVIYICLLCPWYREAIWETPESVLLGQGTETDGGWSHQSCNAHIKTL
jgi:hypothetical protein